MVQVTSTDSGLPAAKALVTVPEAEDLHDSTDWPIVRVTALSMRCWASASERAWLAERAPSRAAFSSCEEVWK
ncbi:hypothetical protein [Kribbella qitaiheensis]|uniref:hypothetical protein n=1 Tax=Kribbella qitaiheensis TaxID=1544730 RepID=UPI0016264D30|nr:hypothetical protein [Kribbella qitaiheensis]